MRLEGRYLSDATDLSDPDEWAVETELLRKRAGRLAAAEERGKRNRRKDFVDAVGGLSMGAALLGANWAVKEQWLTAEAALGSIAGLSVLAGALGASEVLGNWRGEDVEWRAEQKRRRREAKEAKPPEPGVE